MERDDASERRRLMDELQAALETVRAGCESGLRALEGLRAKMAEEGEGAADGPMPPPPARARVPIMKWAEDLDAAVSRLPEVFTKADLVRELGYQPTRGTLLRAVDHLLLEGKIKVARASYGGVPTTYRKLAGE